LASDKAGEVVRAEDVRAVGVIGCGLMGSGIAEVVSRAGQSAVVLETSDELAERGRQRIETSTLRAVERGRLDAEERAAVLGRISLTTDVQDLADVGLVVEAATEDHDTKVGMFRRLDEVTKPEVILASNTSSIPIADLGAATSRPDKVLGMHFFNPVPVMGLIELVRAISTSDDTMAFGRAYGVVLGKTTVESRDRAGFIVNALLIPYLNGAIRMLEDGFATREDIDTAVHLGLNHPMGPLRLIDLIGLDTHLFIANVLFEEFKEPTYAPPPLLRRMVTAGRLGRKVGRGFYDYES
jgi:3-hydroxybutyryl-CoA dehydrogenase